MRTALLQFASLLLLLLHCTCGPPVTQSLFSPLDYAELRGNDGWRLRVHGDGSGTLTHRQHPRHHLDYPAHTFELAGMVQLAARCHGKYPSGGTFSLTTYHAKRDQTRHCRGTAGAALDAAMATAIADMQLAVDDVRSERACRMLRRVWLAAN